KTDAAPIRPWLRASDCPLEPAALRSPPEGPSATADPPRPKAAARRPATSVSRQARHQQRQPILAIGGNLERIAPRLQVIVHHLADAAAVGTVAMGNRRRCLAI